MLTHEKLDVYKCALRFTEAALQLSNKLPRGYSGASDQLRRASISIALNIAEGAGKQSPADKRRFYAIARGSALECAAILDIVKLLIQGQEILIADSKILLHRIVSMLSKLII